MYVLTRVYGKSAYVMLQWNRKVFKFFSGVRLGPDEFNEKTGKVKLDVPGASLLQKQIDDWRVLLLTTALQLEREGNSLTQALIRSKINESASQSKSPSRKQSLCEAFTKYIEYNKLKIRPSTRRNYESVATVLSKYEVTVKTKLLIESIDATTILALQSYLFDKRHCNDNTVSKYMKRIQAVLCFICPKEDWTYIKYRSYTPDVVFLYELEIQLLREANLNGYLRKARDLLLFCCFTGMRYSDTQNYNPSWEHDGLIIYNQQKTNVEAIVPLFNLAKEIVNAYKGCPPKISGQKLNEHLKELFSHLNLNRPIAQSERKAGIKAVMHRPLCEVVSSHIGRKTFIMHALMRGATIQEVMDMSGHSDYRAMKPYITRHKAHLKKLINLWDI